MATIYINGQKVKPMTFFTVDESAEPSADAPLEI